MIWVWHIIPFCRKIRKSSSGDLRLFHVKPPNTNPLIPYGILNPVCRIQKEVPFRGFRGGGPNVSRETY